MQNNNELRFAVLIDADNVPSAHLREMMEEIAQYGMPTYKRIYGDWTKPHVTRWKSALLEHAITPVQQYSYTQGKNSTDSAMIIDAMDILYTGKVEGFCIISSDSDFTRLALRLREAGMQVIGMGQKKTPSPFIAACNKFIYIEILASEDKSPKEDTGEEKAEVSEPVIRKVDTGLVSLIATSVTDLADESGWAFLGEIGNLLLKKQPDFDPRNYGFKKLAMLIRQTGKFDIDERLTDKGNGNIKHVYIRLKAAKKDLPPAKSKPAERNKPAKSRSSEKSRPTEETRSAEKNRFTEESRPTEKNGPSEESGSATEKSKPAEKSRSAGKTQRQPRVAKITGEQG